MFTVNLMGFTKKKNSTKQPTGGGLSVTGTLKEPSTIMNPTIQIEPLPGNASPHQFTYAYISVFGRYYFVEDWTWMDGLWEVKMSVDVLATYKTQIGQTTEYVLRTDSTTDYNEYITDTMYPATAEVSTHTVILQNTFVNHVSDGCYIVGVISGGTTYNVGAITYYAMTPSTFGTFKSKLLSDDNLVTMGMAIIDPDTKELTPTISDISLELLKALYNPYQYIASCMWFPFSISAIPSGSSQHVKLGWWEYSDISALQIPAQIITFVETASLQPHPQASTRGKYLNYAPYTRRSLVGRFGTVPIDTSMFPDGTSVGIYYMVDIISGHCITRFDVREAGETPTSHTYTTRNFLIGVPIQLAQVATDYLGTAVSAINTATGTIGSAVSGFVTGGITGAINNTIASAANGIYNTIQSAMPQVETGGSNGSFACPLMETRISNSFLTIVDEDIHHRGRPLCELRTLGSLTGFILCAEGDVEISCFENERTLISNYLTTGFYWE